MRCPSRRAAQSLSRGRMYIFNLANESPIMLLQGHLLLSLATVPPRLLHGWCCGASPITLFSRVIKTGCWKPIVQTDCVQGDNKSLQTVLLTIPGTKECPWLSLQRSLSLFCLWNPTLCPARVLRGGSHIRGGRQRRWWRWVRAEGISPFSCLNQHSFNKQMMGRGGEDGRGAHF